MSPRAPKNQAKSPSPDDMRCRFQEVHEALVAREPLTEAMKVYLREGLSRYLSSGRPDDLGRPLGLRLTRRGTAAQRKALGPPRWTVSGVISDASIGQLVFELRDGDAHKEDAVATLTAIHDALEGRRMFSSSMRRYLRLALNRYLNGQSRQGNGEAGSRLPHVQADGPFCLIPEVAKGGSQRNLTIEQAFGLKRECKGRPGPLLGRRQAIARDVLLECLHGARHDEHGRGDLILSNAAKAVGKKHGLGKTQALAYWRECKIQAIHLAKIKILEDSPDRKHNNYFWYPSERRVL